MELEGALRHVSIINSNWRSFIFRVNNCDLALATADTAVVSCGIIIHECSVFVVPYNALAQHLSSLLGDLRSLPQGGWMLFSSAFTSVGSLTPINFSAAVPAIVHVEAPVNPGIEGGSPVAPGGVASKG